MKRLKAILVSALLAIVPLSAVLLNGVAHADTTIAGETFTGISTPANQWISGGSGTGGWKACLTAASSNAANSIPSCLGGASDTAGSGTLRLTDNANDRSGFAIYNTPVSASQGLDIQFDMYQYKGDGADGIVFFLIDGAYSPTSPGALGGSLGYSSDDQGNDGLEGGYVGVGFDRYGNFSNPAFGNGGPGAHANSVTVRGSEATNYQFVATHPASGELAVEGSGATRAAAKRHVRITVSTNNIMNVAVDYDDGSGLQTEISNINLNTINGAGSLPATFKFGFSAGTGGSHNIHEISGLTVNPVHPYVTAHATVQGGSIQQGEQGTVKLYGTNDAGAESTTGDITLTDTFPAALQVLSAEGDGWTCTVTGQHISCTRPGSGANALAPGSSTPNISVRLQAADDADTANTHTHSGVLSTAGNSGGDAAFSATVLITDPNDADGIKDSIEDAAPNGGDANDDGTPDSQQTNVTSFSNPVTGAYAVLHSDGCAYNSAVSVRPESDNISTDTSYSYPAGLMNFTLVCGAPGQTATVTQYYYGTFDPAKYVLRKYDARLHTYQTITDATLSTVTIGGRSALKAVYTVTDGGPLDEDGTADGQIVDPAGPALQTETAATLTNTGAQITLAAGAAAGLLTVAILVRRLPHLPSPVA